MRTGDGKCPDEGASRLNTPAFDPIRLQQFLVGIPRTARQAPTLLDLAFSLTARFRVSTHQTAGLWCARPRVREAISQPRASTQASRPLAAPPFLTGFPVDQLFPSMQAHGEARTPYRQAPRPSTISPVCGCSSRTLVSGSTASGLYALLYHVPSFAVVVPHIHASCGCWCPSQRAREFRKPPLMRAVTRTSLIANASPPFQRPRTVGILRFAVSPASAPTPPRQ